MDPNQQPPQPQQQPEQPTSPEPELAVAPPPVVPPKPKRKIPIKKALFVIIFLVLLAGGAILASQYLKNPPASDVAPQAGEHIIEEFPDFNSIPVTEDTISFTKVDNKFCLLYRGHVYLEQETGSYDVRLVKDANPDDYPWYGMVNAPDGLIAKDGPGDELFSFKASPSNKSFVFIMRWATESGGERYYMYRFNNNQLSKLYEFSRSDGLFFVPKLNEFSLGGNFLNLHNFPCATCTTQVPETILYYIPTGEQKNIGRTTDFNWGADDNTYEYKEYEDGVEPSTQPLRRNEFFEESVDLLEPAI